MGLYLAVCGYHDKLPVLSTTLVKTLKDLEVKSDRFDVMYEQVCSLITCGDAPFTMHCTGREVIQKLLPWTAFELGRKLDADRPNCALMVCGGEAKRNTM